MKFQELKKYFGLFILAVALIIVYKTFDNLGIILNFIGKLFELMTPFFIGAAIAFVLRGPCRRVEILLRQTRIDFLRKHRRGSAVLCLYVIVIAVIALIMTAIIPQLVNSLSKFVEQLPTMLSSLVEWINSFGIYEIEDVSVQKLLSSDLFSVNRILDVFNLQNMNKYAKSVINVGGSVVDIFLGIIISVYILLERRAIKRAFNRFSKAFFPEKLRKNTSYYFKTIADFINRYISCQLLDAGIVFILCLIVLSIMQTEYASLIALMVGSFNLIPYFGAFLAILISALIILVNNGFMSAIILVIVLIVVQQVDANIIQPRLVSSSLSIKPLLVILGVVIGGGLFGIIGIFIGVPMIALLKNIFDDIIEKKYSENLSAKNTQ